MLRCSGKIPLSSNRAALSLSSAAPLSGLRSSGSEPCTHRNAPSPARKERVELHSLSEFTDHARRRHWSLAQTSPGEPLADSAL